MASVNMLLILVSLFLGRGWFHFFVFKKLTFQKIILYNEYKN